MVNLGLAKGRGSLPFKDEIASSLRSSQRWKDQKSRIEERNPGLRGFAQLCRNTLRKDGNNDHKNRIGTLQERAPGQENAIPRGHYVPAHGASPNFVAVLLAKMERSNKPDWHPAGKNSRAGERNTQKALCPGLWGFAQLRRCAHTLYASSRKDEKNDPEIQGG